MAWVSWRKENEKTKMAWKERAFGLNLRPIPGVLMEPPNHLSLSSFASSVYRSMAMEWEQVVSLFRRAIVHQKARTTDNLCTNTYVFGDERVTLGSQVLRSFKLSQIISLTIFGPDFIKLHPSCVIKRTKKGGILHVDTMKRMKTIFSLAGQCAVSFNLHEEGGNEIVHSCCGKVRLVDHSGKSISGYLVDDNEDGDKWVVHLLNNKKTVVDKISFDHNNNCYVYNHHSNVDGYKVDYYEPIRLSMSMGRLHSKFILNKVCFSTDNNIVEHCCT